MIERSVGCSSCCFVRDIQLATRIPRLSAHSGTHRIVVQVNGARRSFISFPPRISAGSRGAHSHTFLRLLVFWALGPGPCSVSFRIFAAYILPASALSHPSFASFTLHTYFFFFFLGNKKKSLHLQRTSRLPPETLENRINPGAPSQDVHGQ